jgi:hypothetical protein
VECYLAFKLAGRADGAFSRGFASVAFLLVLFIPPLLVGVFVLIFVGRRNASPSVPAVAVGSISGLLFIWAASRTSGHGLGLFLLLASLAQWASVLLPAFARKSTV